jgi:hypothetical protein
LIEGLLCFNYRHKSREGQKKEKISRKAANDAKKDKKKKEEKGRKRKKKRENV